MKRFQQQNKLQKISNAAKRVKTTITSLLEAIKNNYPISEIQKMLDHEANLEEKDNDGKTCLMCSIDNKDFVLARTLLASGADITAVNNEGITVLMLSVENITDSVFIEELLKQGVDLSVQNKSGDTALLLACRRGDRDMVVLLLNYGADVSDQNKEGQTTLMAATQAGSVETMRILLSAGAQINVKDNDNENALFKVQNEESFFLLLQSGANQCAVNVYGKSVLIYLVANKPELLACIKHLVESGVKPSSADNNGSTPLIEACAHKVEHVEIAKLLLKHGVNPSHQNEAGLCALWYAIRMRHLEITKVLLSAGANPSATDGKGHSLLMQVCSYKSKYYIDIFDILVKAGVSVSAQNRESQSLLMHAFEKGRTDYVKRLLHLGANTSVQDKERNTILHQVCLQPEVDTGLVQMLLKASVPISCENKDGNTPVMIAFEQKKYDVVKVLLQSFSNIHVQDADGKNMLMKTCELEEENADFAKYLTDNGAHVSAQDCNGKTALMAAVENEHFVIVEYLIKAGANVSTQDNTGTTALMRAAAKGNFYLVRKLIKAGACISTINNKNLTALTTAACENHLNIMFWLLKNGASAVDNEDSAVHYIVTNVISKKHDIDLEKVLQQLFDHSDEKDYTLILAELVRSYTVYCKNDNKTVLQLLVKILKTLVEKATKALNMSEVLIPYQMKPHYIIMDYMNEINRVHVRHLNEINRVHFRHLNEIFDIVIKSPFKDVTWSTKIPISRLDNDLSNFYKETEVPCQTLAFIFSRNHSALCSSENRIDGEFSIFKDSISSMLENGFSMDPKFISPLSVFLRESPFLEYERNALELSKLISLQIGVSQRFLHYRNEDFDLLSQQLQLPDALWFAFKSGNSTMLRYLLPYWSSPPLALLMFLPPLCRQLEINEGDFEVEVFITERILGLCLPTLMELGGPLPPGHPYIPAIQTYLESHSVLYQNLEDFDTFDIKYSETFRQFHSQGPPSLMDLCRHVIRGCETNGDDLPQRLSSPSQVAFGLKKYVSLMD